VTIADLGEFGLIAAMARHFPPGKRTIVGIGDDAAVVATPDARVVATTDLLVEGRHFRRNWSRPADIGAKAAARNIADLSAMGADPVALLVGFAAPGDLPLAWAEELVSGMARECSLVGATVVGGDVSGAGEVMLAVTALGDLAGREPVTRAGARPGDVLAVAGVLGHSAAGLALLDAGLAEPASLIANHRRPRPPYQAGPQAARLGATAMIDVSDGLVQDIGHVARASGVQIDIDSALLPRPASLAAAAAAVGRTDPLEWILTGGEDHALAATFPAGAALPVGWTLIGYVHEGSGVRIDGRPFGRDGGWNHFR
jgi:thiamine-monophosphate kinase